MKNQTPDPDERASTSESLNEPRGHGKHIAKRSLTVTALIVVAALLGAALAWRSLDPAALKTKIIAAVMQETGLTLSIEGDIELSLFPLSIDLGGVELENVPGFSASFLVRSDSLAVRIKLLPLLRKHIDMQTLTVKGLELNLERDRYGHTNWTRLFARATPGGATPSAAALAVGGVSIQNASLRFDDQRTRVQYTLDDIAVTTGALTTGEPADMRISFGFIGERQSSFDPVSITGEASVEGKLTVDLGTRTARVGELTLLATATSEVLTEGEARLSVTGTVNYALPNQTLSFERLAVEAKGLKLAGVGSDTRLESPAAMVNTYTGLVQLDALNLHTDLRGPVVPGGAVNIALRGDLAFNPTTSVLVAEDLRIDIPRLAWSDTELRVAFAGDANADLAQNILSVPNLDLNTTIANPPFADQAIDARLRASLRVDVWRSGVVLRDVRLDALDIHAAGDVGVMDLLSRRPAISGVIRIESFNPRVVLEALGYAPPDTHDPTAFTSAKLSTRLAGTRDGIELRELVLEVDDTRLTGSIGARRFGRPKLQADLHADDIDVDRYLCATCDTLRTAGTIIPSAGAIATVTLEHLRALDVSARLRVDQLRAGDLSLAAMDVGLRGDQGVVELKPFDGALYDGRYTGQATIDARGDQPTLSIEERLTGLDLGALLRARGLDPQPPLSDATADVQVSVKATRDALGKQLEIESLVLDGTLANDALEQGPLTLGLRANGKLQVPDARLDLGDIELALGELKAAGQLSVEAANSHTRVTGKLNIETFDPRDLAASLGLPALSTADPNAFRSLALSTNFEATANRLRMDDLVITLDDTRATGHVDLARLGVPPSVRFELAVGSVDANRYLPPPTASEQAEPHPGLWPLAALRALDVDGVITAKQMRLTDVQLSNVKLRVTARDGELRVQPPEPNEQVHFEPRSEPDCEAPDPADSGRWCMPTVPTAGSRPGAEAPSAL